MVKELTENQIFVFGSNLHGNHAGGAALQALNDFGAIYGLGMGIQGQSFAIPTLGYEMEQLPLEEIGYHLNTLVTYANEHPDKEFLLTAIGQGIAGYTKGEIESVMPKLPSNIIRV
jgi:hypothetical protein